MSKFAVDIKPVVPVGFPSDEVDVYDFAEYVTDVEVLYSEPYEELDGIYRVLRVAGTKFEDGRMLLRAVLYRSNAVMEVEQLVTVWPEQLDVYSIVKIETHYDYNKLTGRKRGIYALDVLNEPTPDADLFALAPPFWYVNSECMFEKAKACYTSLSDESRFMFNAIFWNGFDFEAFCRTRILQYDVRNGVLHSTVKKIECVLNESLNFKDVDSDRLVLATFIASLLICFPNSNQKLGVRDRPLDAKVRGPLDALDDAYSIVCDKYPEASYKRLRAVVAAAILKRVSTISDEKSVQIEEVITSYTALRTPLLVA